MSIVSFLLHNFDAFAFVFFGLFIIKILNYSIFGQRYGNLRIALFLIALTTIYKKNDFKMEKNKTIYYSMIINNICGYVLFGTLGICFFGLFFIQCFK